MVQLLQAQTALERISRSGPLIIAHRGFSRQAPENTLPAFRLALDARADLVELDYHHSADGIPVVIHDDTLDRTTDATNRWEGKEIAVHERTYAELATLDAGRWFGPSHAGIRLPTLSQALDEIQSRGCTLIEHKGGDPATLVRILRGKEMLSTVVIQSFDWEFLRGLHALMPDLVLGALGPPSSRDGRKLTDKEKILSAAHLERIEPLGVRVVGWSRQVTPDAIRLAHQRGFKVWIYTLNDPQEARRLVDAGVDGLITDDPALIRSALFPGGDEPARIPADSTRSPDRGR
jgi:glycerophosphoryl diester phosphodiesterase